ncbi:hypothetical protein [Parafrankia sp. FMc2]|uniref:hypothetical protein n=1 Tax=Parafrankia sp. FMc2 TaxID=3233196 RepID=UPI0034D66BAB
MKLADGHHLYPFPGGGWRVAGPGEVFLRVLGPSALVAQLQDRLRPGGAEGSDFEPVAGEISGVEPTLAQLVQALADRGVLVDGGDGASTPARTTPPLLHVSGDGPVARLVGDLAADWARVRRGPVDEEAVMSADVLVDCAHWLPDTHWRQVERWCQAHSTAWTRCHAEGVSLFAGPLSVPGRTARYEDVRGRRLAAADAPEELLAHWAWLDRSGEAHPEVPWPGRGVLAMVAGLLLAEVEAWWASDRLPEVDVQVEVAAPGSVARHPVLPLPVLADPARLDGGSTLGVPVNAVRA